MVARKAAKTSKGVAPALSSDEDIDDLLRQAAAADAAAAATLPSAEEERATILAWRFAVQATRLRSFGKTLPLLGDGTSWQYGGFIAVALVHRRHLRL